MWAPVFEAIKSISRRDPTWLSQRASIIDILLAAQAAGFDAETAFRVPMQNWTVIIPPARDAIERGDYETLFRLIRQAASMTNVSLRLAMRDAREHIPVEVKPEGLVLCVRPDQFARIARSIHSRYVLEVV